MTIQQRQLPRQIRAGVASEWTKLRSVRSTYWLVLAAGILTPLVCWQLAIGIVSANTDTDPTNPGVETWSDPAVSSILMVQYVLVALAMLTVTAEYATGSITTTLQSMPRRRHLMLAKTAVVAGVAFVLGCVLCVLGSAVSALVLRHWGAFDASDLMIDAVRSGCYLALLCALTVGVSVILRSSVGTLTTVFVVMQVEPALTGGTMLLPAGAGASFLTWTADPASPTVGLAVLTFWTALSLLVATRLLRIRDA